MSKIDLVTEMLDRHTDAEIIEHLYRKANQVRRYYDAVISENGSSDLLLTQIKEVDEIEDILKALHKRNQERLAQSQE